MGKKTQEHSRKRDDIYVTEWQMGAAYRMKDDVTTS